MRPFPTRDCTTVIAFGPRRGSCCWGGDGARPPGLWHSVLRALITGTAAAASLVALPAVAQTYPSKQVRIIVPFAPGGSDVAARMLAHKLTEKLGQTFIIDNRPGAAGTLGTDLGAKAPPDGYTLLFATASFAVTAVAYQKLPFDPIRDFAAVGSIGSVPFVLVTHPSLPVDSVRQFVALAKAKPGQLNYGSPGAGGIGHLAHVLFARRTGIQVTHIAYKGTGPAVTALLTGDIQFMMPNLIGALPLVSAGKIKALGVASARRAPLAPQIPTMAESGVSGVEMGTWYGLLAPRGTPQPVIQLLNREIVSLLQSKEFRDQLATRGVVAESTTPEEFSAFIRAEIDKWGSVIKDAGLNETN
jgi:tripartite-type tricarboxylate transporter receptor subunit TctC